MGEPRMAGRKKSKFEGKDELSYIRITNRGHLDIKINKGQAQLLRSSLGKADNKVMTARKECQMCKNLSHAGVTWGSY